MHHPGITLGVKRRREMGDDPVTLGVGKELKVQAVQIDTRDRTSNLQGFSGDNTTPAEQARAWKARFAPTVMFFGPQGQELAERLVGVAVPDFYGEYLDARLATARARLR